MQCSFKMLKAVSVSVFMLGLIGPVFVSAATAPSLGAAATYGVAATTYTNTAAGTTINGDVCYTTGPATTPTINGATATPCATAVGDDQLAALNVLNGAGQGCVALVTPSALSGTFLPGCYSTAGAIDTVANATVTLDGGGDPDAVFIFKSGGALTTGADTSIVLTNGASASNVFWAPVGATSLGANTVFVGNILDAAGITLGNSATLFGRALAFGELVKTTLTNTISVPATLHVIKTIVNNNGGTASAGDWMMAVASSNGGSGTGSAPGAEFPGTTYTLQPGKTYSVSENGGPFGYTTGSSGDCAIANVSGGATYTCTISNNDIPPALHLAKSVINDSGGAAVNTAWTLSAVGTGGSPTNISGVTPVDSGATLKTDTYTLSESGGPVDYAASAWVCVGGLQIGSTVTLALNQTANCTITNNDIAPAPSTLHIIKTVMNDSGGVAAASSFNLHVKLSGADVSGSPAAGIAFPGTAYVLAAGNYTVSEDAFVGYLTAFSGDCDASGNITLTSGQDKTCTVTNDDIAPPPPVPATLHIIKTVVNNNSGVTLPSGFNLHVKLSGIDVSGSPAAGTASPGTSYSLVAGTYAVSEDVNGGYSVTFGGDCDANGNITLTTGQDKTCTVTNDDIPAASQQSQQSLTCNPATQTVTTNQPAAFTAFGGTQNYTWTAIGGNPSTGGTNSFSTTYTSSGTKTVNLTSGGQTTNCTVHVELGPVPPLLSVVKLPTPLALPGGAGLVTYDYTVANIGEVAMSNVTVVDNECPTVNFISGDVNGDAQLDVIESWKYRCVVMLGKTTTNTVTAKGRANGLTAVDTANVTVVVGAPVVPPLIHVVKKPNVFTLSSDGGLVTYTYTVTNPGTAPLSDVRITDDKCTGLPDRVVGHPGDLNSNDLLESNEAWIFTCETNLKKTTTNIGTARGSANGITATDASSATVVVGAPKLPNTGIGPDEQTKVLWGVVLAAGLISALSALVVARRRSITN